jgi:hypothetical protein
MKTVTCNDEAAPWSRNNHLIRTRLLPSSEDSDNNLSGIPCKTRTEMMTNQATLCLGLFNYAYYSLLTLIFFLLKSNAHVCILMLSWSVYFASSHGVSLLCNKSILSAPYHYSSLHLVFGGKWWVLTCRSMVLGLWPRISVTDITVY